MPLADLINLTGQFVNIQVEKVSQDPAGGQVNAWPTLTVNGLTAIPCMIRAPSATIANRYLQNGIIISNHILFAFNVDTAVIAAPGSGGQALSAQHRLVDVSSGAVYRFEGSGDGTGIFNPLILSGEQVYRVDVSVRRTQT